jgi:peptide/nickel transport system substrate-binding protein
LTCILFLNGLESILEFVVIREERQMNKLINGRFLRRIVALLVIIVLLVVVYEMLSPDIAEETDDGEEVITVTPPAIPTMGEQLTIAQVGAPNSLDPTFQKGRDTAFAIYYVFDRLYIRDHAMRFVPALAMYHEVIGNTTWRFHLRPGIKFHNGNDFKANDVKFTVERYVGLETLDPGPQGPRDERQLKTTAAIDKVEIIDDYTVDIVLKYAYAPFLVQVALMEMLDEEYYQEVGDEGLHTRPVGTGPYKVVEWVEGERLVLEVNAEYWGRIPRQVKTLVFTPIPNTDERIQALESGEVDIIASVPPDYVAKSGVRLEELGGTRVYYVGLNVKDEIFDDVRVRQAMNFAVDVDAVIRDVLNGHARKLQGPLYPETFGYVPFSYYEHDPGRARELLDEAGYPDGFEVTLDTYPDPNFRQVAEALIAQYAEVGIIVNLNLMEKETCYARYESGDSQMFLTSWGNKEADADPFFTRQFYTPRDKAYTNYHNRDFDRLVDKGRSALHQKSRQDIYKEALEIVITEAPWVYLYNAYRLCGVSAHVERWQANQFCPDDQ